MFGKSFVAATAATALLVVPVEKAQADGGDFAAGLVTGIIGTIIVNENNKNRPRVVTTTPTRTVVVPDSPQRAANRLTQTALNYFGFNAGGADGIFGPQTARAVSGYQSFMGFPQVGKLASFEHQVLMAAYNRGQAGDFETVQLINTNPLGVRALLLDTRDKLLGVNNGGTLAGTTQGGGTNTVVVSASEIPNTVITPTPEVAPSIAPTPETNVAGGGLPLIPIPVSSADATGYCANYSNGALQITPASMGDPADAMVQLFCQARAEAMDASNALIAGVSGVAREQIVAQCAQLGPVLPP